MSQCRRWRSWKNRLPWSQSQLPRWRNMKLKRSTLKSIADVAGAHRFSEPARPADPMPYLAQLTPFSGRTNRSDAESEKKKAERRFRSASARAIRKYQSVAKKFCRMAHGSRHRHGPAHWHWRLPPRLLFAIILRNTESGRRCAPLKRGLSMPLACLIWNSAVQKRISAPRSWNLRANRQQHG